MLRTACVLALLVLLAIPAFAQIAPFDTTPPQILSVSATPSVLGSPNGKMQDVAVTVVATDDTAVAFTRVWNVTSNEYIAYGEDWVVTDLLDLQLAAKRNARESGRTYTLHIEAYDYSGNRSEATVDVYVPHDQGQHNGQK